MSSEPPTPPDREVKTEAEGPLVDTASNSSKATGATGTSATGATGTTVTSPTSLDFGKPNLTSPTGDGRKRAIMKMTDEELNDPGSHPTLQSMEMTQNESEMTSRSPQPPVLAAAPRRSNWFDSGEGPDAEMRQLQGKENYSLAVMRFRENSSALASQPKKDQEAVNTCADNLRKTFNEIKTGIEYSQDELLIKQIDWEFWSKVVNDYSAVVNEEPEMLQGHISKGIPKELRGMVWQLICNSKSLQLEDFYRNAKSQQSDYGPQIKRDLARTSFITESGVRPKINELFDIIKCYSLYDKEVGYTQGMAFVTVPLLMNMDASEAFCMLAKLMNNYGFRQLYLPEMPGLHLKLYQFDRLLEERLPDLYAHLQRQRVRSTMYATQWFLTLFGYKFPLGMVLRIYDIVIAEGMETILRFALNLMEKNSAKLQTLQFDNLLLFLKEEIFECYGTGLGQLDQFVADSMSISVLPIDLNRYEAEFKEIERLHKERTNKLDEVRHENSELLKEIRKIEAAYAMLNKEHVSIANEMVKGKVEIANLKEENEQLEAQIKESEERLNNLEKQKDTSVDFTGEISNTLDLEIQKTMEKNAQVMEENADLEDRLAQLEQEKASLAKHHEHRKWKINKLW